LEGKEKIISSDIQGVGTMIDDVRDIIERGIHSLHDALPEIRNLASSLKIS